MKVDRAAKPCFVDLEKPTEPRTEEAHHLGVTVRELDERICLGAFACVERDTRDEEGSVAQRSYPHHAFAIQLLDLTNFPLSEWLTPPLRPVPPP